MPRKKIILQTNAPWLKTGLSQNGRYLMKHLVKSGKYDVVYYCTNRCMSNDPALTRLPCKAYGAIPADQNVINQLNADPNRAKDVAYGSHFIDQIVKDEKPDIWYEGDDLWSTQGYMEKPWFKHVNAVFHKTVDSVPVLDVAYQQAKATPNYFTWADFAVKAMKRADPTVTPRCIYGMSDTTHFAPISRQEKLDLRKRMGIDKDAVIFHTTNRNQLRKRFLETIEAFAAFRKDYPMSKTKLHFHTSFAEKANGWDIPRLTKFHGLKEEDVLCTYVCKNCGQWHVGPYKGEDIDCPYCGAQKSMITASTDHGVPDEEMKLMHGMFDAGLSVFDSGGLEYFSVSSLLCGLPTAISAYACGEDFMHLPFVFPIEWNPYYQHQNNFMKAAPKISSLKAFMVKVYKMTEAERRLIVEPGREWAVNTFSVESIGKQWEDVFDALPPKEWSSVTLDYKPKNDHFPMPTMTDNEAWVKTLYNQILLVEPDPEGFKNWLASLANGASRESIYRYFLSRAADDNQKNAKPTEFGEMFDSRESRPGRKRILYVLKESGGDLFIATGTFQGLKDLYPDSDLYVGCEPKFAEILAGNPHVHKVLAYHPAMEQELVMMAYVDHYYYPALPTQRQLAYLTKDKIGLKIEATEINPNEEALGITA